ncbi:MAG: tryptophan synthase subunit alpha [Acidobacteriota bacterium]
MTVLDQAFARCAAEKRAAFVPYITAGDPSLTTTVELVRVLAENGADVIELGVPFSDPIADGPVNQRAAARALAAGTTMSGVLDAVSRCRRAVEVPIVLFTYFNPIHARGIERFAEQAQASGVSGVLCVDLPVEEAEDVVPVFRGRGLDAVFLLAPTSTAERRKRAGVWSSGFVYYVSRTGTTGERAEIPATLESEVKAVRKSTRLPVAVGFGISTPAQVAAVGRVAQGVVVGSALVRVVEEHGASRELSSVLAARMRELSAPLHRRR